MNYTQDIIGARVVMRPSKRWTISAGLTQRSYDYLNAFAFNDPAVGAEDARRFHRGSQREFRRDEVPVRIGRPSVDRRDLVGPARGLHPSA